MSKRTPPVNSNKYLCPQGAVDWMETPSNLVTQVYGSQAGRRNHVSAASGISVIFFSVAPQVKRRSHSHSQIDEIHTHAHTRTHTQTHAYADTRALPAGSCLSGSPCRTERDEAGAACAPPPPGNTHTLSLVMISRRIRLACQREEEMSQRRSEDGKENANALV